MGVCKAREGGRTELCPSNVAGGERFGLGVSLVSLGVLIGLVTPIDHHFLEIGNNRDASLVFLRKDGVKQGSFRSLAFNCPARSPSRDYFKGRRAHATNYFPPLPLLLLH